MGETLANTIKWNISSAAVNKLSGSLQEAYGYVQHLDSSLNDIRIVTGQSAEEMASFAEQANEAASALGRTTTDYTEASLIFAQQGLTGDELTARTEATLKAANVTGQTASAVSEQLTAVWNGFKVGAEDTEQAVDILAAVAASTASDLEELSTGMSKVASAANLMGVNEEQLAAQLSTIISVTRQAPENVGTALTFRA
jgi:TP901 family phage tail tape measure protein